LHIFLITNRRNSRPPTPPVANANAADAAASALDERARAEEAAERAKGVAELLRDDEAALADASDGSLCSPSTNIHLATFDEVDEGLRG
jgi:hypothetical protein